MSKLSKWSSALNACSICIDIQFHISMCSAGHTSLFQTLLFKMKLPHALYLHLVQWKAYNPAYHLLIYPQILLKLTQYIHQVISGKIVVFVSMNQYRHSILALMAKD